MPCLRDFACEDALTSFRVTDILDVLDEVSLPMTSGGSATRNCRSRAADRVIQEVGLTLWRKEKDRFCRRQGTCLSNIGGS